MIRRAFCPCCEAPLRLAASAPSGAPPRQSNVQSMRQRAQSGTPSVNRRRQRVIDIHAHYFPQPYLDLLAYEGSPYGAGYSPQPNGFTVVGASRALGPMPMKFIDLSIRVAEMDEHGVDVQALSLTSPMVYWAPPDLSARLCRAYNNGASAAHVAYPSRFIGLIALPMLDPDRSLEELDRASRLPGMHGVYLGTNIEDRDLSDPLFTPVFEKIEGLRLPVLLHPLKTIGGKRLQPWHLSNLLGNPFDTAIAAAHLIFGGVLDRFPNLEITLPHAGGALPILTGRFDHGFRVRAEMKHMPRKPSDYLRRFTYDTIGHSPAVMKFVISQVGADRVMLGSDYCFDMGFEDPVSVVDDLELSPAERDLIIGGTAARLLRL